MQSWVCDWLEHCELPKSKQGWLVKVASLLEDPDICAELRSYLRTNKWAMNPQKLAEFTKAELLPAETKKYLHRVVEKEMPRGLKKYMELELFPQIQLSVGRGISISTAHHWLHHEGFHSCSTRRHYIMMATTIQMLWTINKMFFCPRWQSTANGWFHIKSVMLKLQTLRVHNAVQWWPQGKLGTQWRAAFEEERSWSGLA